MKIIWIFINFFFLYYDRAAVIMVLINLQLEATDLLDALLLENRASNITKRKEIL